MKYTIGAMLALLVTVASATEYTTIIAVKPHYVQASCRGCFLPEQMGYDVWWEYKNKVRADRVDVLVQVGDKWEVRNGQLYGRPIAQGHVRRGRFPSNSSDTCGTQQPSCQ